MKSGEREGGKENGGVSDKRGRRLTLLRMASVIFVSVGALFFAGSTLAAIDSEGDTVGDLVDNCTEVANPDQRDSDGDGFGNRCDADLNNDGNTGFADLDLLRASLFSSKNPAADLTGDGFTGFADLATLKKNFSLAPGPGIGQGITSAVTEQPFINGDYRVLASNDLGMHCVDLDFQVFSILPPFNVVHAQVVKRGTANSKPSLLNPSSPEQPGVYYSAASSTSDPALSRPPAGALLNTPRGQRSINTSSRNDSVFHEVYKSNFWEMRSGIQPSSDTLGYLGYGVLYPNDVLSLFDPIPHELGIPVPDAAQLPALAPVQQAMPSAVQHNPLITHPFAANEPQAFDRFDGDLPFFKNFPFGSMVNNVNWWAADGIPMFPVDDAGRRNAYPLMRVQAKSGNTTLASLDVVLPVSSEADCQLCHADPIDCADPTLPVDLVTSACNGKAISPTAFTQTQFQVTTLSDAPGETPEQKLLNAAKLNILRLHDARHGSEYTTASGAPAVCDASDASDPDCLVNQIPVQCSQCHYSPALDLAQVGPIDEPSVGDRGRQQTRHRSMSNVMHGYHGQFTSLFPDMPPPVDGNGQARPAGTTASVLAQTCYTCHPGKRTQCLRGVMASAGIVCQDCHGELAQVGNDFTHNFPTTPFPAGADLTKRVPWASEPACQSCHTGDAVSNLAGTPGTVPAGDNIRLLQAYLSTDADAKPIQSPGSRFAENESLYRLSKGHGGLMCEACHGSTHAEWPAMNPLSNDNIAATQLQGHRGTLIECSTCHEPTAASLPLNLDGPHGMHPVADHNGPDSRWNERHEDYVENQGTAGCKTCHGVDGLGTVLSRTAAPRRLECKNTSGNLCGSGAEFIDVPKGTAIGCADCHSNYINGEGDDD